MAKKLTATKTVNPLHFEDLEPHRFEDLVRRLLYGFKEWTDIEPTGRAGADEGFDVRAWEKDESITNTDEDGSEGSRLVGRRLWQVQGKREKSIAPGKMRNLIKEGVSSKNPPYGYILAAATNISKSAYDVFRTELKVKGVAEFHFWGKDYLEDQLALPQNDEILFTFFGLSLSPRRRSRTVEMKFVLNNKNKIQRLLFGSDAPKEDPPKHKSFMFRDIKDTEYPKRTAYSDFDVKRRWEEHEVVHVTPRGLFFQIREWYACVDTEKKEWDVTKTVDLTLRKENLDAANRARGEELGKKMERYWRHLPLRVQARAVVYGFVSFADMLIIDDKGDATCSDPHIYIDFGANGPFERVFDNLVHSGQALLREDWAKYERAQVFPATPPEARKGAVHEVAQLGFTGQALGAIGYLRGSLTLYGFDSKLSDLREDDLIRIPAKSGDMETHGEVTHIYETTVKELSGDDAFLRSRLKDHAGRDVNDDDKVRVCEIHEVYVFSENISYADRSW